MPEVQNTIGAVPDPTPQPPQIPDPSLTDTIGAAFSVGNDVVNTYHFLSTRHSFPADPNFDLVSTLKKDNLFDTNAQDFVGANSLDAYNSRKAELIQTQRSQDVLARSGKAGIAAMLGAGLVSPTMFLPFIGEARGLKGVAQTAKNSLMAAAIAEVPILANDPNKPVSEVALDMGTATVLGAILGGAHVMMRPEERQAVLGIMARGDHMAIAPDATPISASREAAPIDLAPHITGGEPGGLSSQSTLPAGAGNISPEGKWVSNLMDTNQITRSPVTSTLAGESNSARYAMSQLADAGLSMEGNRRFVTTTPGGTVENRVPMYYALHADVVKKLDDMYKTYYLKGDAPGIFGGLKAQIGGFFPGRDKMSRADFNTEVTRAGWSGDVHDNPHVQEAAQYIRQKVFDPILEKLQGAGLLGDSVKVLADKSYVHRLYNHDMILKNTNEFVQFLSNKFEQKLNAEFAKGVENLQGKAAKDTGLVNDLGMTAEESVLAREKFLEKLNQLNESRPRDLVDIEDQLAVHRAGLFQAQEQKRNFPAIRSLDEMKLKNDWQSTVDFHKDAIKALEEAGGNKLTDLRKERRAVQERLSSLGKAQGALAARQRAKINQANKLETTSLDSLHTLARAGQTFLNKLDRLSDKELDAEYSALQDKFAKLADVYDRGEARIKKLKDSAKEAADFIGPVEGEPVDKLSPAEATQSARADRLTDLTDRLTEHETLDREEMRSHVGEQLDAIIDRTQKLNSRRALREAKLREEAKALDPQKALDRIDEIKRRGAERETNFLADVRDRGGNDVGLERDKGVYRGTANFGEFAQRGAREVKDKILGTTLRSPTIDMMQGERAAVLARVLDIPSQDLEKWLDTDIERIVRSYLRTSGPDIEIAKKLGDVAGEAWLGPEGKIVNEMNDKIAAVETAFKDKSPLPWKKGKRVLTQAEKEKEQKRIFNEFQLHRKNLETVIKRLRHQDGLPSDPNSIGYRLGKVALDVNVLRYMGGVTLSSLPDVARVVMRYGALRTFRDGFVPMVTNFKQFRLAAQEAKYAGAAIEVVSNSRGRAINEIFDDMHRGTKLEKGLDYLASKQGIVGAFAYWTDAIKQFTGVVANAKLMDSIAEVMTKDKVSAKTMDFLASNGIGRKEAAEIWAEALKNGGAERVNGVWMPNTESWTSDSARETFRAAIAREVNNQVVTPGVERPLWMTGSMTGRLLGQFKSFAFSSTTKMLQAGLQQRDMAVANGMALSLAFGALSYYLYAITAGGSTEDEMRSAGLGKWADEAIARSGVQGAFGLGQDLLSRIPATQGYSSFSGGRTLRHGGGSLVEALAGPSFDALEGGARVVSEINDPDSGTVHAARKLLPWQNVTGVRKIFDAIEAAVPVPEKRQ